MSKKELEALRRLRVLQDRGLMEDVVKGYEEDKQVFFSDYQGFIPALYYIEGAPNTVLNKIKELTDDGNVVYHATHEVLEFGECWDLFLITDEDVSSYGQGMREDFDNYGIQFAYVVNMDVPEFSEFGSIQVRTKVGGIERIG